MIIGDLIVRHIRAMLAEGKVHTLCCPGARVLDVSVQIPVILKDDESVAAVVIHAGVNDTKLWQAETLKRDYRSLIEKVTQHIARDDNDRVKTSSHVSTRTRKVQLNVCFKRMVVVMV